MIVTRGFSGRGRGGAADRDRVPPGQFVTPDFPVLTAGPTQHTSLDDWSMSLEHDGGTLGRWTWREFEQLRQTDRTTDIHCVTKWTKFDTRWRGVTVDELLSAAGLAAAPDLFVIAHCDGGYTTNLPAAELLGGKAMIATHYEDLPLPASHGGPARLLVPHLYLWKSAKWVRKLQFVARDKPGFWESLGYHNFGDPWREQRYTGDP
ncbi:molybdopterin-dependent oxidoreductase [Sphingomonas sp. CARO-RG-8B-R24-01]|uniref:molybdopterin-dependent oxidoreductase n=1 Tax=Sphingomonas sp. CARO-RG-8B-R24-01 TaxID=2914831 RepID=UPI001F59239D|nr:molybdopterin-dependent oxidoreductase [Sphingomonas sp. CARO-RG-8B-R24-01]